MDYDSIDLGNALWVNLYFDAYQPTEFIDTLFPSKVNDIEQFHYIKRANEIQVVPTDKGFNQNKNFSEFFPWDVLPQDWNGTNYYARIPVIINDGGNNNLPKRKPNDLYLKLNVSNTSSNLKNFD